MQQIRNKKQQMNLCMDGWLRPQVDWFSFFSSCANVHPRTCHWKNINQPFSGYRIMTKAKTKK